MRTLSPLDLEEGMLTAEPVKTAKGQLIVDANTKLTRQLINHIRFYRIPSVKISDIPNFDTSELDVDSILEEMDETPKDETTRAESEPKPKAKPEHEAPASFQKTVTYSQKLKMSSEFTSFQMDYFTIVEEIRSSFHEIVEHKASVDYSQLLQRVSTLFRNCKTTMDMFDMLHNMRAVNDSIYAHCLNVALISRMIGRWLRLDAHDLDVLTMSGLLHDIGKVCIAENLLNKPGKLTEEEFSEIKKHPKYGYDLLKNQQIDPHIKKAALMHHERCDGSGYPMEFTEDGIDDYAMIVAIADVYDAMTAARSYRAPMCPFQVIANFEKNGFQKFHTQYILTFLKEIAETYRSNRVILSDGRGCVIVMLNQNCLSRPVVQFDSGECLDLSTNTDLFIKAVI